MLYSHKEVVKAKGQSQRAKRAKRCSKRIGQRVDENIGIYTLFTTKKVQKEKGQKISL